MNNPGAFLRRLPEAEQVLRVFGCDLSDRTSDYEFFFAFCKASDRLLHHRLLLAAKALFSENACREALSADCAGDVWRFFAEKVFWNEPEEASYAPDGVCEAPGKTIFAGDFVALDGLLKQASGASDCSEFEAKLLSSFTASGRRGVLIDLPDSAYLKQPDPYAVSLALKGEGDKTILSLQALRIFSAARVSLLISLRERGERAIAFFSRLDRLVGLPQLFLLLSPASLESGIDCLLSLAKPENLALLQEGDLMQIASTLYYRYPIANCALLLQEKCRKSCKND